MQLIQTVLTYPSFQCAFRHVQGKVAKLGATIRSYLPEQISSSDRALSRIAVGAIALASLVFIVSILPSSGVSLLAGMAIGSALAVIGTLCGLATFSAPNQEELRRQFLDAVQTNNIEYVYWLLGAGVDRDVNVQSVYGNTSLVVAVHRGQQEIVTALLGVSGIDVNIRNHRGVTALTLAIMDRREEMVQMLLRASGIHLNQQDLEGNTALILAVGLGYKEIVEALLRAPGIDVNVQNRDGSAALILAADAGQVEIVELFLRAPIRERLLERHVSRALIGAVRSGSREVVNALLRLPAIDVNRYHLLGNSALVWAARLGHTEIAHDLLLAGAYVDLRNSEGRTAQEIAREFGQHSTADAIQEWTPSARHLMAEGERQVSTG